MQHVLAALALVAAAPAFADPAVTLDLTVPGISAPLVVAAGPAEGEWSVTGYPAAYAAALRPGLLTAGILGVDPVAACAAVPKWLDAATDRTATVSSRQRARHVVRDWNDLHLTVDVLPLLAPALEHALRQASAAEVPRLLNPLVPETAVVAVELAPDALSHRLGDLDALTEQATGLFNEAYFLGGAGGGALTAYDLYCDLRSGKAKVVVTLTGSVGGAAWDGKGTYELSAAVPQ